MFLLLFWTSLMIIEVVSFSIAVDNATTSGKWAWPAAFFFPALLSTIRVAQILSVKDAELVNAGESVKQSSKMETMQ